jgi:hypothetical protein
MKGLYELFTDLLLLFYERKFSIMLKHFAHAKAEKAQGWAGRLSMVPILTLELLCAAGVAFMIRFLIALHKDARTSSEGCGVQLTSRYLYTKDEPSTSLARAAAKPRDVNFPGYQVIPGGRGRPYRRVG